MHYRGDVLLYVGEGQVWVAEIRALGTNKLNVLLFAYKTVVIQTTVRAASTEDGRHGFISSSFDLAGVHLRGGSSSEHRNCQDFMFLLTWLQSCMRPDFRS